MHLHDSYFVLYQFNRHNHVLYYIYLYELILRTSIYLIVHRFISFLLINDSIIIFLKRGQNTNKTLSTCFREKLYYRIVCFPTFNEFELLSLQKRGGHLQKIYCIIKIIEFVMDMKMSIYS